MNTKIMAAAGLKKKDAADQKFVLAAGFVVLRPMPQSLHEFECHEKCGPHAVSVAFSGCLALLLALPIAAFPRELPGHKAIQAQRVQETQAKDEEKVEDIKSIKDLPR